MAYTQSKLGFVAFYQGDYSRASALIEKSLAMFRELGIKWAIAMCLEGLGEVAGAQRQPERAARLFGATEALHEAIGSPLLSTDRPDYNRSVAAVRAGLGEEAFAKAWEEGRRMTMEEAIQLAVGGGQ